MIDSKEISVIVQGGIDKKETPKCLNSIRKILPNAEIILSTWNGADTSDLDYDKVIYNEDPGTVLIEEHKSIKTYNNMNRQLLSTQSGLKIANRKYSLKLRSDLILTGKGFINYFEKFQKRIDDYKLFQQKIVTSTLFTRYNIKSSKHHDRVLIPFHISDWWFFGLTKDLKSYFLETNLVKEPDFTNYFRAPENKHKDNPYVNAKFKFAPEQYFGYECFARNYNNIHMEDAADVNDELIKIFEKCLVNNFIVLEYKQSGIYLNKYLYSKNEIFSGDQYIGLYNFYRYEETYKKICDDQYIITSDGYMFQNEKYGYDLLRVYKHIFHLVDPKATITKRVEQLLLGIPISLISFLIKHYKELFRRRNKNIQAKSFDKFENN